MDQPLPASDVFGLFPIPPPSTSFLGTLLREPLLHFVLFGGLVFGADHIILSQREDPLEIGAASS